MAKRRKNGTGTVRKRADGRWEGRVVTGYDDNGLPKTKNVLGKTKKECLEKLKVLQEQYSPPIRKCKEDMPFGDWIAFWYYELFLLELGTGLRLGEILALRWTDLNFTTGELRITKSATFIEKELVLTEPKTKSSIRSIILPPSLLKVLGEYKKTVNSRWMFPSPVKADAPIVPSYARRRMQRTLERAGRKKVRFHDLRHTFATMALEHGMDVKTLSTIIGHVSSATTLDIYSHVIDTMQKQAAVKIDHQIGKTDAPMPQEEQRPPHPDQRSFQPYQPKHRKPGTGCVYQINDHLWEGKYSPKGADGKRIRRNVYAKTREECEEKLAVMIEEMKREIAQQKQKIQQQSQSEIALL